MSGKHKDNKKKSIFHALFIPLLLIMLFQAVLFYVTAVYGGIEETMNRNAADILTERLINRKNEIETSFTKNWANLDACKSEMDLLYERYTEEHGHNPFVEEAASQADFLSDAAPILVQTLRSNGVSSVFLILNDQDRKTTFHPNASEYKMGLCIRDLDPTSSFTGVEDLLIERAPSAVIEQLGCSLDSWWEAKYMFESRDAGAFYYNPLDAAWDNPDASSEDLAYVEGAHKISDSDQEVMSYSIPLMDKNGYPYGVLGVELTTKYLTTLLPSKELNDSDKGCYVLALQNVDTKVCTPITGSGAAFSRCFGNTDLIDCSNASDLGGFQVNGRDGTLLYGAAAPITVYNNNNPFESEQLTLVAFVEKAELFSYVKHIKRTLAMVSAFSLFLGLCGLLLISRRFSKPITALAKRVQSMPPKDSFSLGRIGIQEIDQLVDSIEELNRNVSRDIARTEFFSRMSHDMRTPMNAIISFSSEELLEGTNEEQKLEYLEKIHSSGSYLLGLINEVLDMTKIESNKIELQYNSVAAETMWDTILPIIDKLAQKKQIMFQKDIRMEKTAVLVDEQHLNQIVMNLLSNAVKFTPKKGAVTFMAEAVTSKGDSDILDVTVRVSDTGIGMSSEFQQHLYTPFEQENDGLEGTGLGLSIAKKLVEMMKGTIECISEKGAGTTFTIHISLQKCDMNSIVQVSDEVKQEIQNEKKQEEIIALQGKRVLVCEDHPLNTQIITKILERVGIHVTTAPNGQAGLDLFCAAPENSFDAVLMDIRMPVMDGLETARQIRRLDREDAKQIPIIAMTANAFAEDVEASSQAGMNAHLSKPVDPTMVYNTLQQLMKD